MHSRIEGRIGAADDGSQSGPIISREERKELNPAKQSKKLTQISITFKRISVAPDLPSKPNSEGVKLIEGIRRPQPRRSRSDVTTDPFAARVKESTSPGPPICV